MLHDLPPLLPTMLLAVASALPGAAMAAGSAQPLCFSHVGASDKPMPGFCLVAPSGPAPAGQAAQIVPAAALAELVRLAEHAPAPVPPTAFGTYELRTAGWSGPRRLGPASTAALLRTLAARLATEGHAPIEPIIQTMRRLGLADAA